MSVSNQFLRIADDEYIEDEYFDRILDEDMDRIINALANEGYDEYADYDDGDDDDDADYSDEDTNEAHSSVTSDDDGDEITYSVVESGTDGTIVVLHNVIGPNVRDKLTRFFHSKNIAYALLESTEASKTTGRVIARWVIFDPTWHRNYIFADSPTFAEILKREDKSKPFWLHDTLTQYSLDIRDDIGQARELDYDAGRMMYGIMKYIIMQDAIQYETEGRFPPSYPSRLRWLQVMTEIIDTMAPRYEEEDPDMLLTWRARHDEFLELLSKRFVTCVSIPYTNEILFTCLKRQDYLHVAQISGGGFSNRRERITSM